MLKFNIKELMSIITDDIRVNAEMRVRGDTLWETDEESYETLLDEVGRSREAYEKAAIKYFPALVAALVQLDVE